MTIEPGGGKSRVLAKRELQEEKRCSKESNKDGVDEEECQAPLLDDHHGERPEGVEGDGEGPAGEEMIRPTRPLLVLLKMFFVKILMKLVVVGLVKILTAMNMPLKLGLKMFSLCGD